jgi:hypothetical protein
VKQCIRCKKKKCLEDFYKNSTTKDQRQKECKQCNTERKKEWYVSEKGKKSSANTKLKARFGITLDQYEEMYKQQDGKCLICGATESIHGHRLAVDHCHTTLKIRGLLCKSCNVGLGNFYEKPELLRNAAKYIEDCTT